MLPASQTWEAHWVPAVHALPGGKPHLKVVPLQVFGLRHSDGDVHEVRHPPLASHWYGLHETDIGGVHVPAPLQVDDPVFTPALHVPAAQTVPTAYSRQPPIPSHQPSVPQEAAPMSVQTCFGSVPDMLAVQVPRAPAFAHDLQPSVQVVEQQIPCSQKLL